MSAGGGRGVGGRGERWAEVAWSGEFTTHVGWRDNIMSQGCLCSSFWASLALGEADGISGPVIHQLVQVVSEGPLALLGVSGRGSECRGLGEGSGVALTVA